MKIQRNGYAMQAELEAEEQTSVVDLRRTSSQFGRLPSLPAMDDLAVYVLHPDAMQTNTRKIYVHDRMQAPFIYILKYAETKKMMTENRY